MQLVYGYEVALTVAAAMAPALCPLKRWRAAAANKLITVVVVAATAAWLYIYCIRIT